MATMTSFHPWKCCKLQQEQEEQDA